MRRLALAWLLAGCVSDPLPVDGAPCPCLDGYVCCEALDRCLASADADACPDRTLALTAVEPAEGPVAGGTAVTLRGRGFEDDVSVRFGGRSATAVVVTRDRIECVTPPGATDWGAVDVVVERGAERVALPFHYVLEPFVDRTSGAGLGSGSGLGLAFLDADGDDLPDVVQTSWGAAGPVFFRNRGGLVFEPDRRAPWDAAADPTAYAWPGDFTGDGRTDLAVSVAVPTIGQPLIHVYAGQSGGRFGAAVPSPAPRRAGEVLTGGPADVDGDGDLDLLGCRSTGTLLEDRALYVAVLLNEGGRLVEAPDRVTADPNAAPSCSSATVGDVDADGDPDLVLCGEDVRLLVNDGGRFVDRSAALGLPSGLNPLCRAASLVDYDADGDLDLAWASQADWRQRDAYFSGTFIARNDRGRFTVAGELDADPDRAACAEARAGGSALAAGVVSASFFDADHDGDLDAFVPYPSVRCPGPPVLYESRFADGEEVFRPHVVAGAEIVLSLTALGAADLDADDDLDVLAYVAGVVEPTRLFRNNLTENDGTAGGPKGAALWVRALTDRDGDATDADRDDDRDAWGVTVLLDLDGPDDAPDFAPGRGQLLARAVGESGSNAAGPAELHFGTRATGARWLRVTFPDGSVTTTRVEAGVRRVALRDCGARACD